MLTVRGGTRRYPSAIMAPKRSESMAARTRAKARRSEKGRCWLASAKTAVLRLSTEYCWTAIGLGIGLDGLRGDGVIALGELERDACDRRWSILEGSLPATFGRLLSHWPVTWECWRSARPVAPSIGSHEIGRGRAGSESSVKGLGSR
jgi:hypothetical protein